MCSITEMARNASKETPIQNPTIMTNLRHLGRTLYDPIDHKFRTAEVALATNRWHDCHSKC